MDELYLRPANLSHCRAIWLWANDVSTRRASLKVDPIPWSEHVRWFYENLQRSSCSTVVATLSSQGAIGMVRCSVEGSFGEISLNVAPEFRGRGLGTRALFLAIEHFFQNPDLACLNAKIKQTNRASLRLFQRAGFGIVSKAPNSGALVDGFDCLLLTKPRSKTI